jgi:hypothetical protein
MVPEWYFETQSRVSSWLRGFPHQTFPGIFFPLFLQSFVYPAKTIKEVHLKINEYHYFARF